MNFKKGICRRLMVVAMTAAYGQMTWAQTAEPAKSDSKETESKAIAPETEPISSFTSQGGESDFGATISPNQLSITPSYELSKRGGQQPGLFTARAYGVPVRFDGGVNIYLSAVLAVGHDDNLTGSTANKISSRFTNLQPYVVTEVKNHGDRYTASYQGNYARFFSSTDNDFDHHEFQAAGDNIFSSRARLGWLVGYLKTTDAPGSTDRALSATPDRWHAPTAAALFAYGAQGAIGRVEVETSLQNKRYENNRDITIGGDVDLYNVAGRFFYRVAPKTSLLVEARQIKANYLLSTSPNSNTDRRLLLGATWAATAATTGIFKIGYLKKRFADPTVSGYSGLSWEGTVHWVPLTYSVVDITTSKAPSDATGTGDYILNRNVNLLWTHHWSETVATRVDLGLTNSDYHGVDRQDDIKNYGVGVTYDLRRWLKLCAKLERTQRSSNQPNIDFSRNVILLTLEGTL